MEIKPNEVLSVEEIGMMDKKPVKLARLIGGFWVAIGTRKGKSKEEIIGGGSHSAIVKFNLEQHYPDFQPSMQKSENFNDNVIVQKHSHFLDYELRKSGYDVYSIQNNTDVQFLITKQNINVAKLEGYLSEDSLCIRELNMDKKFIKAFSGATSEKALDCKVKKIRIEK